MDIPNHLALLQAIADLIDAADADATDTEALAAATGRATFGPPWFAMDADLQGLEEEGFLEIGPGAAVVPEAGRPAPPSERCVLRLTDAGRAILQPTNSA